MQIIFLLKFRNSGAQNRFCKTPVILSIKASASVCKNFLRALKRVLANGNGCVFISHAMAALLKNTPCCNFSLILVKKVKKIVIIEGQRIRICLVSFIVEINIFLSIF
jgi:hypothetical protein